METQADADGVCVSAYTYDFVREKFDADYRGKIEIKAKGELDVYSLKPQSVG